MARILIIGGVAVGATAAARLSRLNPTDEIIIFERDEHISFANCGLPYYLSRTIPQKEDLVLQTPESFHTRHGVEVRIWHEVIQIKPEQKEICVKDIKTATTYTEKYDYLILSPGARPIIPSAKGLETVTNLHTIRNIADIERLDEKINQTSIKDALVIGAGFIGLEMAENLAQKGLQVTIINKAPYAFPAFDAEMASFIENALKQHNITLKNNTEISSYENSGKQVILNTGEKLNADIIIMAVGVSPENNLAKEAGLQIGKRGGIVVNDYLQTSNPYIYAGGDAIEVSHYLGIGEMHIPLAGPANRQGRLIADNINGKNFTYKGSIGSSVLKIFNYTAATTGLNINNIPAHYRAMAVHVSRSSHANYYPDATEIFMKLLFDKDTKKILGVQAFGEKGVEKRIDVLATAIKAEFTIDDLTELELTYAPPYSSAKDPVNIVGYIAQNIIDGMHQPYYVQDVAALLANDTVIIDVRTADEYHAGHIPNSINIPLDDIRKTPDLLPTQDKYYITCQSGHRAYIITQVIKTYYPDALVYNLSGGYRLYQSFYHL